MNPLTSEWVEKAEGDFATTGRELRARKNPNYDAACFHAQQCAEKYLKAMLQEADIAFAKTHNLISLLDLLLSVDSTLEIMRADLQQLTTYSVNVRYPGESTNKDSARGAMRIAGAVRSRARRWLGLVGQRL